MKLLLNLKMGMVLVLSCILFSAIVISCKSSRETLPKDGVEGDKKERKGLLTCVLPGCSGSECCHEDDNECNDWCDNELGLGGSGRRYEACINLGKDTVGELVDIFEEKLKRPTEEDLDNLGKEEMELICGAVKELDHDVLGDRIEDYNQTRAKQFLEWAAENEAVADIFKNAEKDEGVKMFRDLLHNASGASGDTTDQGVLDGLTKGVNSEEAGEHVLYLAFKENNEYLVEFIHEKIISDKNELCDDKNHPEPDTTVAVDQNNDGDTADVDDVYASNNFGEEACVLGVYCKIASSGDDASDFRKDMAKFLGDGGHPGSFIKEPLTEGGLGGTEEDAEDWSDAACEALQTYWNDKEGGLVLGLSN